MIEENRALATDIGAVYKFVLHGEGGGTFVISLCDPPGVTEGDLAAQCTLHLSADDFVDMFESRIDSRHLFFAGKLKVEGNIGLGLKLKKFLDSIRKQRPRT
jgi:predicted lipid carrier protein YhbT